MLSYVATKEKLKPKNIRTTVITGLESYQGDFLLICVWFSDNNHYIFVVLLPIYSRASNSQVLKYIFPDIFWHFWSETSLRSLGCNSSIEWNEKATGKRRGWSAPQIRSNLWMLMLVLRIMVMLMLIRVFWFKLFTFM